MSTLLQSVLLFIVVNQNANAQTMPPETFTVTLVPAENGSYTVDPEIADGAKVKAGTVLTVSATPSSGFSLDVVYYTVKGGMWGTTSYESFSTPVKITVDRDMSIGATFVDSKLVENLKVTQDVVYARPGIKPLKYDVYAPLRFRSGDARDLPCIVIVHGGGWSSNNEDIMRGLARELAKGGRYVVFSIDYR